MFTLRKFSVSVFLVTLVLGGFHAAKVEAAVGAPVAPACDTELVSNGSFEVPALVNPQGWDVVASGQNGIGWSAEWVDTKPLPGKPVVANIELQNGRPAHAGSQYTELDSDYDGTPNPLPNDEASVQIFQDLNTKIGSSYKVVFYTSPLPGYGVADNIVKFSFGPTAAPVLVDTITEDGTANNSTVWTKHEYTLSASTLTTRIVLEDGGIGNSFGSLVDAVSVKEVCAGGGGQATYALSGKVWNDADGDQNIGNGEAGLAGWSLFVDTNNNGTLDAGETVVTSQADGSYVILGLVSGSYTVREVLQNGWTQTLPTAANLNKYSVTIAGANVADINFGNKSNAPQGGGGGGGVPPSGGAVLLPVTTPTPVPTVLGGTLTLPTVTTAPTPQVLGETTELPRTGLPLTPVVLFVACVLMAPFAFKKLSSSL